MKKRGPRKPREVPPPGWFIRSRVCGCPAELVRTSRTTKDGRWIYRLWYGDVLGTREWTTQELLVANVRWLTRRPRGLNPRGEPRDPAPAAQVAE